MTGKIKLNYNGLVTYIESTIDSEDIEEVLENALAIDTGLQLLNGYMKEIAEHTIETKDPWLVEWCRNLEIIKVEDGDGNV